MKTRLKIIIFSSIALIMLVVGLIFAINYKKESIKYFYDSGYVINNVYEDNNINKIYFDSNTAYESKGDTYSFKNSDGKKVTVNDDSFIHYTDGSVMSLKDGVAIDLDKIDSKLLSYYNVFSSSILKRTTLGYEISNLNDLITFNKLMYKISNTKYLVASENIVISFSDDQTISMNDYAEIEYINDNVIRIYNEDVNYQTIASNLFMIIDDIKIDLEHKTISKNDIKYLTMADMVINAEDNIEILPQTKEPEKEKNSEENNTTTPQNNGGVDNNTNNLSEITNELNNIQLPEQNEEVDNTNNFIQPKFTVESMDITALGFQNLKISVDDESAVLYGDRVVEVVENTTGRVIKRFEDWQEGIQNYAINQYFSLKPNTAYTLNVTGQYKIEDAVYDRTFISKIFRTLDIGLEIDEDYATSDSLSFVVYKNSYSDVNGFTYTISDINGQVIVEDKTVSYNNKDSVIITETEQFKPNTEYELTIKDIKYGNAVFSTLSYENLKLTKKQKTLKENPSKDIELDYNINNSSNTIRFGLKGINDTNGGITTYTYKVYNSNSGELLYTTVKDKYSDLELNISDLGQGETFYYNVEMTFDDNEKTVIITTNDSNPIVTGSFEYPKIVRYESYDDKIDCETLFGSLVLDDSDNFIQINRITNYRIILKEKANSIVSSQQYEETIDVETEKNDEEILLPVKFENLKPNTDYVLYVYLKYDTGYVYLGYENVKTKEPDPIYLNLENSEQDNNNLFSYKVSKGDIETSSISVVESISFDLYGCSNNNACAKLEFSRTIPKDQTSDELISVINNNETIAVNSSEFGFYLENYSSTYSYYKVVVTSFASEYEIPTKLNGTDSNEFILEISDIPPTVEIKPVEIPKQDCVSGTECYEFYNNKDYNNSLDDDTIVGLNFEIKAIKNIMNNSVKNLYYSIYESDNCSIDDIPDNLVYDSKELQTSTENVFIPVGNFKNSKISRGTKYCVVYYGEYESDGQTKKTDNQSFDLLYLKQPSRVSGHVKSYNGTSITFSLNVTDVDKSIEKIYISDKELDQSGNDYTFSGLVNGEDYALMLDENLGEGTNSYKLYDAILDEINTYTKKEIKVIVDTSTPGKISFKIPYAECEDCITNSLKDKTAIAGLLIGNKKIDLKDDGANLYSEVNLSNIDSIGLEIKNGKVTIDNIKVIYDSGLINEDNSDFFIKLINESSTNKYFNNSLSQFSPISTGTIFTKNSSILNNIEYSIFSSKEENSSIGQKLAYSEGIKRFVNFNSADTTDLKLLDIDENEENTFSVNEILSTSKIKTVHTSTGAKIYFDITYSNIPSNTKLKIALNNGEEAVIEYNGTSFSSYNSSGKIKSVSSDDKSITVEFQNLTDSNYSYSIEYSKDGITYETTYNDDTKEENKNIPVSELKGLTVTNAYSNYNKTYWNWTSEEYKDMVFLKEIVSHFDVNTSKYELGDGESIKFDLVARNISTSDEIVLKENESLSEESDNQKSINNITINSADILNQFNGNYNIVLKPKLGSVNLEEKIIGGTLTITRKEPEISVVNNGDPFFKIEIDDADGVLSACSSTDEINYTKEPMLYDDSKIETYYKDNGGRKVSYIELYSNSNNLVGYYPMPFTNKTTTLNLYKFFADNNLFTSQYNLKIKYCINDILHTKEFGPYTIHSNETFDIDLVKMPRYYLLIFNNPDSESINSIYTVEYQYEIDGNLKYNTLYKESLSDSGRLDFTVTNKSNGDTIYYLGLPTENVPVSNISNFMAVFKNQSGDFVSYYSE